MDGGAVSQLAERNACKCFTTSDLAKDLRVFVKVLVETNVNISNELNFSDVYRLLTTLGR